MINYISARMDRILRSLVATLMTVVAVALSIATLRSRSGPRVSDWFLLAASSSYAVYLWVGLARDLVQVRRGATFATLSAGSQRRDDDVPQIKAIRSSGTLESLLYGGVLVARDRISLIEGDIETRTVANSDVDSVTLVHGVASTNPTATLVVGIAVVLIGLAPVILVPIVTATGQGFPVVAIASMALAIPGMWIIRESIRKRLLLRVASANRVVLFSFDRAADPAMVRRLAHSARRELGVVISLEHASIRNVGL